MVDPKELKSTGLAVLLDFWISLGYSEVNLGGSIDFKVASGRCALFPTKSCGIGVGKSSKKGFPSACRMSIAIVDPG